MFKYHAIISRYFLLIIIISNKNFRLLSFVFSLLVFLQHEKQEFHSTYRRCRSDDILGHVVHLVNTGL